MAIKRGDQDWEAGIVAQLHKLSHLELSKKEISPSQWAEQNYNFHFALIAGCQSPTLLEIRRHLYMKFDRYCHMSYQLSQHTMHDNDDAHQELAKAVLERNTQQAKKLMTEHINGPLKLIIEEYEKHNFFKKG